MSVRAKRTHHKFKSHPTIVENPFLTSHQVLSIHFSRGLFRSSCYWVIFFFKFDNDKLTSWKNTPLYRGSVFLKSSIWNDRDFLSKGKWDTSFSRSLHCWSTMLVLTGPGGSITMVKKMIIMATCLSSVAMIPRETCQSSFCHADNGQLLIQQQLQQSWRFQIPFINTVIKSSQLFSDNLFWGATAQIVLKHRAFFTSFCSFKTDMPNWLLGAF